MRILSYFLLAALAGCACWTHAGSLIPPMNGAAADFAPRRAGAEVDASVKITVSGEGLFRLDQPALVAAGVDPMDLSGNDLRLFCATQEVAIRVSNGGLWTASDYLVFFAKPFDGSESDRNIYWLGWGGAGKRMAEKSVLPIPSVPDTLDCDWTVHQKSYAFLQDKYLRDDPSFAHWFLMSVEEDVYRDISLPAPEAVADTPAYLRMVIYGHSISAAVSPDHRTRVQFNGVTQGDYRFDGQIALTNVSLISGTGLAPSNRVSFRQILHRDLAVDRVYLRALSLSYTRRLVVDKGALVFPGKTGPRNYRLRGFTRENMWLLDVTDPDEPVFLTDFSVYPANGAYVLRFGDETATASRYAVCQASKLQRVEKVEKVTFRDWAAKDWTLDYLVIAPDAFLAQAQRLVQWRTDEGLASALVPLNDIYNEFGYGVADSDAIKQFLGYAYHHWQQGPRYVVLAGTGSYDPRGYLIAKRGVKAFLREERVPLHMGPNPTGWTSLDGWFAQVDGTDKLPDFALGRLTAQTSMALSNMVNKIIAFESVPKKNWRRREALLIADYADRSLNGKAIAESLRKTIFFPGGYAVTTGYVDDLGEYPVRQIVEQSFQSGVSFVTYLGHGAMDLWGYHVFDAEAASRLRNTHYPIVMMMACRNGAFQNPVDGASMVEGLMNNGAGGASACVASTAMSFGPSSSAFIHGILRDMVVDRTVRLGDGFLKGLADMHDYNPYTQELLYMNLFGDPAMVVNPL